GGGLVVEEHRDLLESDGTAVNRKVLSSVCLGLSEAARAGRLHVKMTFAIGLGALFSGAAEATPTLVGHWTFDDISERRVEDRSAKENHGRISGSPTTVPGIAGRALRF